MSVLLSWKECPDYTSKFLNYTHFMNLFKSLCDSELFDSDNNNGRKINLRKPGFRNFRDSETKEEKFCIIRTEVL